MATVKRTVAKAVRKAKVIQVRVGEGNKVADALQSALDEFFAANPGADVLHTDLHMLDIGGASQADIIAVYTIIYAA